MEMKKKKIYLVTNSGTEGYFYEPMYFIDWFDAETKRGHWYDIGDTAKITEELVEDSIYDMIAGAYKGLASPKDLYEIRLHLEEKGILPAIYDNGFDFMGYKVKTEKIVDDSDFDAIRITFLHEDVIVEMSVGSPKYSALYELCKALRGAMCEELEVEAENAICAFLGVEG